MLNNIHFTLPYYAGIMLNAFNDPLYSKLCWRNRRVLIKYRLSDFTDKAERNHQRADSPLMQSQQNLVTL